MTDTVIIGNFSADGSSEIVKGAKAVRIDVGTNTNANFGGGTLNIKMRAADTLDWTTLEGLTTTGSKTILDTVGANQIKVQLEGATSPDLDYSITWR